MSVTLQFSRQQDAISNIIADFTRAWPSHVDIVWGVSSAVTRIGWLLGARSDVHGRVPAGVQFRAPGYAPFTKTEQISLPANAEQENMFYCFLAAQIGKSYDKLAIAGLALDRDWRSPNKWFCSELVAAALENAGIIHQLTSPVNFISPRDVLMIAEAMQQ